jgi:hypothetical protein
MLENKHPIEGDCPRRSLPASTVVILFGVLLYCIFGVAGKNGVVLASAAKPTIPITGACSSNSTATCVMYSDGAGVRHEVALSTGKFELVDAGLMGTFSINGSSHQLAYVYGALANQNSQKIPWISVIDLNTANQIAHVASPVNYTIETTWFDYIQDPTGAKYPFLAPGAHYLKPERAAPGNAYPPIKTWNYLCIFDPAYIAKPDLNCDSGFKHYSTDFVTRSGQNALNAAEFRHAGGWIEDVDGDGWGDINLPYMMGYILTLSGKTGRQIGLSHFDVAAKSEPNSPPYFHGGRFKGSFADFTDPQTRAHDVLIADGDIVGNFKDMYCGVSRYFAVAQWSGGQLQLRWSDYLSFTKTIFLPPYVSTAHYSRLGDDLNKCAHRFSTSLEWIAGNPYVVFDLFLKDNPTPDCQQELLAEQASHFDPKVSAAYENVCTLGKALPVPGHWSANILDAKTGAIVRNYPNLYIWGNALNVVPNESNLLLAQQLTANGGDVRFDQTAKSIASFALVKLASGPTLTTVATLAAPPAAPLIIPHVTNSEKSYYGGYPPGIGSSQWGITTLILRDIDGDGFDDIELENGRWIGWSMPERRLIVKTVPPSH